MIKMTNTPVDPNSKVKQQVIHRERVGDEIILVRIYYLKLIWYVQRLVIASDSYCQFVILLNEPTDKSTAYL